MAVYSINFDICATWHLPLSNHRHNLLTHEELNKFVFTYEDKNI